MGDSRIPWGPMPTFRALSTAFFLLLIPAAAPAQSPIVVPGLLSVDENAEGVDQIFARDLARLGQDRDRAAAGQIDPSGYLRTNLDGMPAEVLDGLLPLGATIAPLGQDPFQPDRTLRAVEFSGPVLTRTVPGKFRPDDRLVLTVAVDRRRRLSLVSSQLTASPAGVPAAVRP